MYSKYVNLGLNNAHLKLEIVSMDTNEGIGKTSQHCKDKEIIDKK